MLKIDNKLNKIDMNNLKDPIKKVKVLALGTLISVNLYSGATLEKSYSETKDSYSIEKSILNIPECYKIQIEKECGININDLDYDEIKNIKSLTLNIKSEESLDFLSEFYNLKKLSLCFETPNNYVLDTVPEISSLENLTIEAREDLEISDKVNNLLFKNNKDNIKYLSLDGIIIGPNVVENLSNLETLKLATSLSNDLDYSKLKIDTLDITDYGQYDIPIFLSRKDYIDLIDNDVNFMFDGNEHDYIEVLNKLDIIIESLEIEDKTEVEQIESIICYILDNLKYDSEVQDAIDYGGDVGSLIEKKGFYDDGNLKGALECETQICGNYTALCKALLKELNIKSFYTLSETHSWNLIEVENESYYVDLTYIDTIEKNASERIKNDEILDLDWYMENPEDVSIMDDSEDHEPVLYPKYFNNIRKTQDDKENNNEKISSNKEINAKVNNKNHKIPLAALVGILVALGLAIPAKRKRKKVKKIENRKHNNSSIKFNQTNEDKNKINFNNDCNYYDYKFKGRK